MGAANQSGESPPERELQEVQGTVRGCWWGVQENGSREVIYLRDDHVSVRSEGVWVRSGKEKE